MAVLVDTGDTTPSPRNLVLVPLPVLPGTPVVLTPCPRVLPLLGVLLTLLSLPRTVPTRLPRQHLCRDPLTRPPMWP